MCTLSWWCGDNARGVLFSRDEKRTRSPGLPPRLHRPDGTALSMLMPMDPDAGGTWIGINERGLIVALLNYYPHDQEPGAVRTSRGMLVRDLLESAESVDMCREILDTQDLRLVRGFLLFAFGPEGAPMILAWDGKELAPVVRSGAFGRRFLTTSSVRLEECLKYRGALFEAAGANREKLREAHKCHNAADPALGPLMARDDAATESLTEIVVENECATIRFETVSGNPPTLGEPETVSLVLKPGS